MVSNNLHFSPHFLIRNTHVQTFMATQIEPTWGAMTATARTMALSVIAEEPVRLQGFYSPQPDEQSKGLVLLLHGWLGSANSVYMVGRGEYLFEHGYSIFRLNMRDHGGTEMLNEGLFHGCRLEEVFQAVRQIAALEPDRPFYLIGFSMGGNFALRLAWRHSQDPISNLRRVIAISPSMNAAAVVRAIDGAPFYRPYFVRKWRKNLAAKQAAFPDHYDFAVTHTLPTCWAIGKALIERYSDFPSVMAYYRGYTFTPAMLSQINVPLTIITAADDPVIPVEDFTAIAGVNPLASIHIMPHGGHVGFIDLFPFRYWLNEALLSALR